MQPRVWHRFYDEGVPPGLDFETLPLTAFLERSAREHGDGTSLIFLNRQLTYRQLQEEVDRFATALSNLGVTRGTRVAIQLPNLPQTVIAFYAVLSLGAIVVMTNPCTWSGRSSISGTMQAVRWPSRPTFCSPVASPVSVHGSPSGTT